MYHPPVTVELRFDFRPSTELIARSVVVVPDPRRVACFRFGRSPLVKRSTMLTMNQGMPSGFKIERPSPAKAFTGILKSVSGTIADAIPTIVNVKVNRQVSDLSAQEKLANAQSSLATSRKTQLDSEKALADAIAAANAAATGAQSGRLPKNAPAPEFFKEGEGFKPGAQSGIPLFPLPAAPASAPTTPAPKKRVK